MRLHTQGQRRSVVAGVTLVDFRGATVDVCARTVTIVGGDRRLLNIFRRLLRAEGIGYARLPAEHPLWASTVRLRSAEDLQRFLCLLSA